MDCGSLEGLLRVVAQTEARALPEGILAAILFQALQGLLYLHRERHAVHRDLKPANILLDSSKRRLAATRPPSPRLERAGPPRSAFAASRARLCATARRVCEAE